MQKCLAGFIQAGPSGRQVGHVFVAGAGRVDSGTGHWLGPLVIKTEGPTTYGTRLVKKKGIAIDRGSPILCQNLTSRPSSLQLNWSDCLTRLHA